jgi:hypothetical protein
MNKAFTAIEMRRSSSVKTNRDNRVLPPFQTVRVRLTQGDSGDVLFEGRYRVTFDPLIIVSLFEGSAAVTLGRH